MAAVNLADHVGCIEYVDKYLAGREQYLTDTAYYIDQAGLIIRDAFEERVYQCVAGNGLVSAVKMGREDAAYQYARKIIWDDKEFWPGEEFLRLLLKVTELPLSKCQTDIWRMVTGQEKGRLLLQQRAEADHPVLPAIWCCCGDDYWYAAYMRLMQKSGDVQSRTRDWELLFHDSPQIVRDISKLKPWELEDDLTVSSLLKGYGKRRWMESVDDYMKQAVPAELAMMEQFLNKAGEEVSFYHRYFRMRRLEKELISKGDDEKENAADYEDLRRQWMVYVQENLAIYQTIYREEIFENMQDILPPDCRLALVMQNILKNLGEGRLREAITSLKEVPGVWPDMSPAIKKLTVVLRAYLEERDAQSRADRKEFYELATVMKEKIQVLLATGHQAEAETAARQLLEFMPEDEELRMLLK